MKLEVGQKVYLDPLRLGNAYRYSKEIIETEITEVGRKYFKVKYCNHKFQLDTMLQSSKYSTDYKAYFSKQELEEKIEMAKLEQKFMNVFNYAKTIKLSLNQLREIDKIISGN